VRSFTDDEIEVLRKVARRLKEENKWSGRELGAALGIAQQNAGRFVAKNSNAGMDRTTANRLALKAGYRDVEHLLLEEGVLAEMKPLPTTGNATGVPQNWRDRDVAIRIAIKLGYSQLVIDAVVHRYTEHEYTGRPLRWWVDKIVLEALSRAGDPPQANPQPGINTIPGRAKGRKNGTEG
jgi:hypothetical protein